jgi:peptide/nickel transport system substrate-binding protein
VTLDCPNDRYVNDEAICQAVVSMLARIGIKVSLHAQTKSKFFQKVRAYQTSFYLMGWQPGTTDLHDVLFSVMTTKASRSGVYNGGRYSHPRVEQLAEAIAVEMDPAKRQQLMSEVQRVVRDDVAFVPLHQQMVTWAVREGVEMKVGLDGEVRQVLVRMK